MRSLREAARLGWTKIELAFLKIDRPVRDHFDGAPLGEHYVWPRESEDAHQSGGSSRCRTDTAPSPIL